VISHISTNAPVQLNSTAIPPCVALASAVVLLLHAISASSHVQNILPRNNDRDVQDDEPTFGRPNFGPNATNDLADYTAQQARQTLLSFQVTRLISCLVLLGLSVYTVTANHRAKDHQLRDLVLTTTYVGYHSLYSVKLFTHSCNRLMPCPWQP
jgi:hypothetical protein